MKKNKSKLLITISLIIILIIIALVFSILYIKTDILKSNKQLFFKYAAQIVDEEGIENNIEKYFEKKEQNMYENEGKISINSSIPDSKELKEKIQQANKVNISFNGNIDNINKKVQEEISLNYSEDVSFPITYIKDEDIYGIQTDYIGKKYIAIENNNLEELFEKFGINDTEGVANKIENISKKELSDEEKKSLKEKYENIIKEQLKDEQFSKTANGEETIYTLEITPEQIKNILTQILENVKNDVSEIESSSMDNIIENINNLEITDNIKIAVYQKESQLKRIAIEKGNTQLVVIEKTQQTDGVQYNINCNLIKDETESNIYFNIQYSGIDNLENIQETYTLGIVYPIEYENEAQQVEFEYKYENNVSFNENISIEDLNSDNAIILNEQEPEYITNLFNAITTRMEEVNAKQMEELGVEENPLLYANPITMLYLGATIYQETTNTVESMETEMENAELQAFNYKILKYEGKNKGAIINSLIQEVEEINETDEEKKISIEGDFDEIEKTSTYNVKVYYDEEGYINKIIIEKVE
ncbi:MAG: hypothetical protein IJE05_05945 [Clostridia bacterium]|nr:hypothetical protein [Clostridia bacterium]